MRPLQAPRWRSGGRVSWLWRATRAVTTSLTSRESNPLNSFFWRLIWGRSQKVGSAVCAPFEDAVIFYFLVRYYISLTFYDSCFSMQPCVSTGSDQKYDILHSLYKPKSCCCIFFYSFYFSCFKCADVKIVCDVLHVSLCTSLLVSVSSVFNSSVLINADFSNCHFLLKPGILFLLQEQANKKIIYLWLWMYLKVKSILCICVDIQHERFCKILALSSISLF